MKSEWVKSFAKDLKYFLVAHLALLQIILNRFLVSVLCYSRHETESVLFSLSSVISMPSCLLYLSLYIAVLSVHQQFLGFYDFKSKTHQDACCPEGMCRAAVFALHVKEELTSWPEQSTRRRTWLTLPEATSQCRYQWMQEALVTGFSDWHDKWSKGGGGGGGGPV
jgi:hypothetical protein